MDHQTGPWTTPLRRSDLGHTSGQTGKTEVQADHSFQKIQEKQIELYNVNS